MIVHTPFGFNAKLLNIIMTGRITSAVAKYIKYITRGTLFTSCIFRIHVHWTKDLQKLESAKHKLQSFLVEIEVTIYVKERIGLTERKVPSISKVLKFAQSCIIPNVLLTILRNFYVCYNSNIHSMSNALALPMTELSLRLNGSRPGSLFYV